MSNVVHADENRLCSITTKEGHYLLTVRKNCSALEGLVDVELPCPTQRSHVNALFLMAHKFGPARGIESKGLEKIFESKH